MNEVEQLREVLTTKLDYQSETLERIETQTTRTNGRADRLEKEMAEAQRLLAAAVERLNAHDREIRDLKQAPAREGGSVTWREARIIGTTVSLILSFLFGAYKVAMWLIHEVRQP